MAEQLIQNEVPDNYWATQGANVAPTTALDSMGAQYHQSFLGGLTGSAIDAYNIYQADQDKNQKTLSVPELNAKYNGSGITWTEPKKERVAEYIAQAHQQKADLANRVERGDGGVIGSIGRGGVSVATFLGGADPIGMAAGLAGGTAFRAAGLLTSEVGDGIGSSMVHGLAEGAAVMTPIEAAQVAHDRMMENDVNLTDSLKSIAMGSLIGAGIEGGIHAYKYGVGGKVTAPSVKPGEPPPPPPPLGTGAPPEHSMQVIDVAARQMEEGLKPNVKPLEDLYERQRQDMGPRPESDFSGRSNYEHAPIDATKPVSGEFYHGNPSGNEKLSEVNTADHKNSPESFGSTPNSVTMNDNAMKANGYAEGGIIHSGKIEEKNLLPLDATASDVRVKDKPSAEQQKWLKGFKEELATRDHAEESLRAQVHGTKVIDQETGGPLRLFHGTDKDFGTHKLPQELNYNHEGSSEQSGQGTFFDPDPKVSNGYTKYTDGGNIRPAYLNIKNPLEWQEAPTEKVLSALRSVFDMNDKGTKALVEEAIKKGIDGGENGKWGDDLYESLEAIKNEGHASQILLKDGRVLNPENWTKDVLQAAGFDGAHGTASYVSMQDKSQWIAFDPKQIIPALAHLDMPPPAHPEMNNGVALGHEIIANFLETQNMPKFADELMSDKITPREAYANLTENAKNELNSQLKEAGYDGLHFNDAAEDGSHPSNGVMMFDKADVTQTGAYNADKSVMPGFTEDEKTALTNADNSPSRELHYDQKEQDAVKELQERVHKDKPDEQSAADIGAKIADNKLKALKENGVLTEAHQKEWDAINEAMADRGKQAEAVTKSMFDCIVGH